MLSMKKAIKDELDRLASKKPKGVPLDISTVIETARNPRSPLHQCFTWNKDEALQKNLEFEARRLLNHYYEVTIIAGKPRRIRHFVSLTTDRKNGNGYRMMSDVLSNEELYLQLLEDAMREFQSFERKYALIKELKPLFKAAKKIKQQTKPAGASV